MIVFDLRCIEGGEVFEGWFSSTSDYQGQLERGLVQCPVCGSAQVEKAPMAPRVGRSTAAEDGVRAKLAEMAAIQQKLLSNSEYVGEQLPETARAMHLGEVEKKAVHGQASVAEAKALIDEGVPIMPLPLPIVPPGQVN
ncbi:DUF1178 family protein [Sphingomonas sp. SM33]|uniref:DUF1178 family protein n=1 Tax=Sphingomonas telluris TaxID=2907998 RepID=A0ABS9VNB1_9SPHN|nr:DUF1178 family protein [Sphingomonas telluris]